MSPSHPGFPLTPPCRTEQGLWAVPLGHGPFTSSPWRTVNTGDNAQGSGTFPIVPAKSGRAVGTLSRSSGLKASANSRNTGQGVRAQKGRAQEGWVGVGFLREFVVGPRHVEAEPEAGLREAISQWILTKKEEKVGRRAVRT